jgi:hypothetical protein
MERTQEQKVGPLRRKARKHRALTSWRGVSVLVFASGLGCGKTTDDAFDDGSGGSLAGAATSGGESSASVGGGPGGGSVGGTATWAGGANGLGGTFSGGTSPSGGAVDGSGGTGGGDFSYECDWAYYDHDPSPAVECVPHTICQPGEVETRSATYYQDRTCEPCPAGTFADLTNDSSCQVWSDCELGMMESVAPTATSDRQCHDSTTFPPVHGMASGLFGPMVRTSNALHLVTYKVNEDSAMSVLRYTTDGEALPTLVVEPRSDTNGDMVALGEIVVVSGSRIGVPVQKRDGFAKAFSASGELLWEHEFRADDINYGSARVASRGGKVYLAVVGHEVDCSMPGETYCTWLPSRDFIVEVIDASGNVTSHHVLEVDQNIQDLLDLEVGAEGHVFLLAFDDDGRLRFLEFDAQGAPIEDYEIEPAGFDLFQIARDEADDIYVFSANYYQAGIDKFGVGKTPSALAGIRLLTDQIQAFEPKVDGITLVGRTTESKLLVVHTDAKGSFESRTLFDYWHGGLITGVITGPGDAIYVGGTTATAEATTAFVVKLQ